MFADHVLNWGTRRLFDNDGVTYVHSVQLNKIHASPKHTLLPLYLSARNERTHAMDNKWRHPFALVSPPELTDSFFFPIFFIFYGRWGVGAAAI